MELNLDTTAHSTPNAAGRADLRGALFESLHRTVRQIIEAELARAIQAAPHVPLQPRGEPAAERRLHLAPRNVPLSPREREVLVRIAAGDSNKQIARRFALSLHTVKRHVANILGKIGVSSRAQAAAWLHASSH
jgi:DNA-binding CsgD family transcriptional regulator